MQGQFLGFLRKAQGPQREELKRIQREHGYEAALEAAAATRGATTSPASAAAASLPVPRGRRVSRTGALTAALRQMRRK